MACSSIVDGAGTGNRAKVDKNNMLETRAVTESIEHYVNHTKGQAYSISFSQTPTGANDCFLYIKNTNTHAIVIEGVSLYVASNEIVEVYLEKTGTPSGGSAITPVNLNTASNNVITATLQEGADITGLSGGSKAYRYRVPANNSNNYYNFEQDVILSPQQSFTLYAVNGSIAIEGFVDLHYVSDEVEL